MKKILVATAAATLMCGAAFAQNTGPAAQSDNMNKPGSTSNSMNNNSMNNNSMSKGMKDDSAGMNNSTGMSRDSMKKEGSGSSMKQDSKK